MTEIIYGYHAVRFFIKQHSDSVKELYAESGKFDVAQAFIDADANRNINVKKMAAEQMHNLLGHSNHQGIAAKVNPPSLYNESYLKSYLESKIENKPLFLILDCITDPHNLGACLRTAETVGVDAVILPKDKSVGVTPVVRKVACGAADLLPIIQVVNIARVLRLLQDHGIWVLGMAGEGDATIYSVDMTGSIAVVVGSEEKGLRRLTREHCDYLVRIPMSGNIESLNVSVATGITLFEAARQRQLF